MQRFQRGGHSVVIRAGGVGEAVLPLIIQDGGLGSDRKDGGSILRRNIAVIGDQSRAAGDHAAGGGVHHGTGGVGDPHAACQAQYIGAGDALKGIALLEADLLPGCGQICHSPVFQAGTQFCI